MANEEIFEINDFSTASDWERFISQLEEILTQWNLNNNTSVNQSIVCDNLKQPDCKYWQQKEEKIKFGKVEFNLIYLYSKNNSSSNNSNIETSNNDDESNIESNLSLAWRDMNSLDNDWQPAGHPLVRYYGLSQFLLLIPLSETISTEDRTKQLIASAAIALQDIDCEVPFFCQISNLSRKLFMGVGHISNGFRTYFNMIQLPSVTSSFQYLNELIVLFKKKLYSSFSYHKNIIAKDEEELNKNSLSKFKIQISIRFTYIIKEFYNNYLLFNHREFDQKSFLSEKFTYFGNQKENAKLNMIQRPMIDWLSIYGDPIREIQLGTTWPSVAEELLTDNAHHSDLQSRNAPRWSLRILSNDAQKNVYCKIVEVLLKFIKLSGNRKQLFNYLSNDQNYEDNDTNKVRLALDRLSSPSSPIMLSTQTNHVLNSVSNLVISDSNHIPVESIDEMVQCIFNSKSDIKAYQCETDDNLAKLKSTDYDSLSWRLSNLCSNFYAQTGQISNLAQIWKCFLNQLRAYWQSGRLLPHLDHSTEIDYRYCLFHQKLQMLNCCIAQKIKCEHQFDNDSIDLEGSDEEFFDAEDQDQDLESMKKADGQMILLKDANGEFVYLLSNSQQKIYVPLTQDPAPITEDALAKQEQLLSQIEDAKTKIRIQSAGLLSDMESFKAANPGCQFEDFIRWHSPNDWSKTGGLSRRMRESVIWNDLWHLARPCPVRRQKRLFNYTKEAEEILQYFQNITISDLVQLLSPIVVKSAIQQLIIYRQEIFNFIEKENVTLTNDLSNLDIFPLDIPIIKNLFHKFDYLTLCQHLIELEFDLIKFFSVFNKFIQSYQTFFNGKSFAKIFNLSSMEKTSTLNTSAMNKQSSSRLLKGNKHLLANMEITGEKLMDFLFRLLSQPEVELINTDPITQLIVQIFSDNNSEEKSDNHELAKSQTLPSDSSNDNVPNKLFNRIKYSTLPEPKGKEFIIRAHSIPRPAPYSRPSSHRMYCLLSKDFRAASAFTEDTAYF